MARRVRISASGAHRTWRRSLQLRMVTYTLVSSSCSSAIFGVLVVERTTTGLVAARVKSAESQVVSGSAYAQAQLNQSDAAAMIRSCRAT